jgi:23S rRNA pseudouridine1911/1915/1917 synthase
LFILTYQKGWNFYNILKDNISNRILYEDNHLLIINKLNNEIVQKDDSGDDSILEYFKQYIKEKYNKPGDVFLGLPHRLDRPVSGIVVLAKTSKALTRLTKMFKDKEIHKIYHAIVKDKPIPEQGEIRSYIKKNVSQNKSYTYQKEVADSKLAILNYKLISKSDSFYLLEIELLTGRHHQIRAQLAEIGSTIKGDVKYGYKRPNIDKGISLHARMITFVHPVKNEEINVIAPYPTENTWSFFR